VQCSIDGCEDLRVGRGYCSLHYSRLRMHGDPLFVVGDLYKADVARGTKRCRHCDEVKKLGDFSKDRHKTDGLAPRCRDCRNRAAATYREAHHDDPVYKTRREAAVSKWRAANPEKWRSGYRAWQAANRERNKDVELKRIYGIGLDDYEALLARQGGRCAICGVTAPARGLFVDHCHDTGMVRGLLCGPCNSALGFMGDDSARLRLGADYLDRFS
jgi:hypothetical protein